MYIIESMFQRLHILTQFIRFLSETKKLDNKIASKITKLYTKKKKYIYNMLYLYSSFILLLYYSMTKNVHKSFVTISCTV